MSQIKNLMMPFEATDRQEQVKPQINRKQGTIKIRSETNEIETENTKKSIQQVDF